MCSAEMNYTTNCLYHVVQKIKPNLASFKNGKSLIHIDTSTVIKALICGFFYYRRQQCYVQPRHLLVINTTVGDDKTLVNCSYTVFQKSSPFLFSL